MTVCTTSYGRPLSPLALVAHDGVLEGVTPCCVAGRVFLEFLGQFFDVFGFEIFAPEAAAGNLVGAFEAGVCVFYGVGVWLLFFVGFVGTLLGSSGVGCGRGCFLWDIVWLFGVSIYLSSRRKWLAFLLPRSHVGSAGRSTRGLGL